MKRPRHQPTKAELLARMPRAFRPKLDASQRTELGICHWQQVDAIQSGAADAQVMWSMAGGVLTWSRIAELLGVGVPEMKAQLEVVDRLIERFKRTGRVGLSGPDLQLAKEGATVMDDLAEIVDKPTAIAAAEWSELEVQRLADEVPVPA